MTSNKAAASIKTDAITTDTARIGGRVVRVHAAMRCPRCLRPLHASGVCEIGESEFAWRCARCHRDIITITTD